MPVVALGAALALVVAGCGRSAPEDASPAPADGAEPAAAGVQVVSAEPVVTPAPTTPTTVAATPPPSSVAPAGGTYVVESGDTLSVIAERFGVTIQALSDANGIDDVNTIRPGQELVIPAAG